MSTQNTSVEHELWMIYTFYSLHADPSQPEVWRVPTFVRFAKDCQIVSKRVTSTVVELEIANFGRAKRAMEGAMDYSTSLGLEFSDFLCILKALAQKVYPRDATESAIKRLLLENVLLLANRRTPLSEKYNIVDPEALKVVDELFQRPLTNIYNYYVDKADRRRNALVSGVATKHAKPNNHSRQISNNNNQSNSGPQLADLKELVKSQKGLIGYVEFIQFCQDFSLRSTALLTAIQVGEIFLESVPFGEVAVTRTIMGFPQFCRALVVMAVLAYRDCDAALSAANKVKALMLFMWKAMNKNDQSQQRMSVATSHAGSLNICGSGLFSDFFLAQWQKEGYPEYTSVAHTPDTTGLAVFKRIVMLGHPHEGEEGGEGTSATGKALELSQAAPGDEAAAEGGDAVGGEELVGKARVPVTLRTVQLQRLFKMKPELAEFIYLEMINQNV